MQELPSVLWSLRTTPSRATGHPFFLCYGAEAVLPTELSLGSPHVRHYDEDKAEKAAQEDSVRLEEEREAAVIESACYQQLQRKYHSRNVHDRSFSVGDLVMRHVQTSKDQHKISPPWEGPYKVIAVTRPGSYRLVTMEGHDVSKLMEH